MKMTKAEFNERNKAPVVPSEASDEDKKALIVKIYKWQQEKDIFAWDEESLNEDLDMSIQGFTVAGKNEKGLPVEVEFQQPLDEDVENEGVAFGYRLVQVSGGIFEEPLYNLKKYRKHHKSRDDEEEE